MLRQQRIKVLKDIGGCTLLGFVAAMVMFAFVADADEEKEMSLLRISAPSTNR